ncbi:MAG: hypothetical protein K8R87_08260 [Verrucomicrobia bacterium]|nr:hypothetical protein [Verrucomicrobiota bacterium]
MRRLALYSFVITLLWLGFVSAISFLEAPIKFKAGVELKDALSIGRLVFHALNRVEWVCCIISWLIVLRLKIVRARGSLILLAAITAILAFQTWGLFPTLDTRAIEYLHGNTPPSTWHHPVYIGVEIAKAVLLGLLASMQIQSFARAVISE